MAILPFLLGNFNSATAAEAFDQVALKSPPGDSLSSPKVNQESPNPAPSVQIKTIVIDAGHGGHDPGCLGSSSHEKDIALGIALNMAASIRQDMPGVDVILTRDEDVFIPLNERAAIANRNEADLFISIHCNYIPKASFVQGSETYVLGQHRMQDNLDVAMRENSAILYEDNYEQKYDYDPNSPEGHIILSMFQNAFLEHSILFAQMVENHMTSTGGRHSRGVKQAGFLVLRETAMPSVLVETGFLSNKEEEDFLRSEAGQKAIADVLVVAFKDYKEEMEDFEPVAQEEAPKAPPVVGPPAEEEYLANNPPVQQPLPPQPKPVPVATSLPAEDPPAKKAIPAPGEPVATMPGPTPVNEPVGFSDRVTPRKAPAKVNVPPPPPAIEYRVQLAAASDRLNTGIPPWNQLDYPLSVIPEQGMFKYQAGHFSNLKSASTAKNTLRARGFEDAFVVAYKGAERITIAEARRALGR